MNISRFVLKNFLEQSVSSSERVKISSTNANIVDTNSLRKVISFGKNAENHNGGTCTFRPDGYLYLALGDGGNATPPNGNGGIVYKIPLCTPRLSTN